jgi:uncharacterized membrane protein YhaH (DUF805 family)
MDYAWFLFSFEGRINRARYWLAALIIVCWTIFLALLVWAIAKILFHVPPASFGFDTSDIFRIVDSASLSRAGDALRNAGAISTANLIPLVFYAIGTPMFAWCYAAISIKRLHDRNKSGWWMVPFFVVPGLFDQFEDRLGDSFWVACLGLIMSIMCLSGVVEMCFLKGASGPNRFGPDPLAPADTGAQGGPRRDPQSALEFVPHGTGLSPGPHVKRGHD